MILSLLLAGSEEANDPVGIKGVSRSPQAPCRQTCFLCPFCRWHTEQYDRTNPFIQALFWCSTPLLEQMIVVRSLPSFSFSLWHRRPPCLISKGGKTRGILCQLDDVRAML